MEVTKYELLIVAKLSGSSDLLARLEKVLKDSKAENINVGKMGKKVLAYPIKKQTEADYFVLNFDALGSSVKDLTDMLRLEQEALLRYLLIKDKPKKASKRKTVVSKKEEVAVKKESPKVTVVTKKVAVPKKVEPKVEKTKAKKVGKK